MHGQNPGRTVLEVHPVGAQNKTLISETEIVLRDRTVMKGNIWFRVFIETGRY